VGSLDLEKLKKNKTEIIKAEIGALLFNLGKTHINFKHWSDYFNINAKAFEAEYGYPIFTGYRDYYTDNKDPNLSRFKEDLKRINEDFPDFFYNTKVGLEKDLLLSDIVYGDGIEKKRPLNVINFVKNILFHGCENVNSGIDKGEPLEKQKLKNLWISNAFGSFKEEVKEEMLDKQRICFFKNLWKMISSIPRKPEDFSDDDWIEIRNFVFEEVKNWYSHLLSDSRFPINDVTLWDQAYMTASLFKASLAAIQLDSSKYKDYIDNTKCRKIRWSILGVQYDKLALAEKALKAHFIKWYRDAADKADKMVKDIIETEYALGNEIYRDETGIYFIIPENAGDFRNKSDYIFPLNKSLKEIADKIMKVFSEIFGGEIYPSIFTTKPSRGMMNITYLLEKSRENFLKASYPTDSDNNFEKICKGIALKLKETEDKTNSNFNGLCQACNFRLARKSDEDLMICDGCKERKDNRIEEWIKNINGETIWTGDLKDSNDRIAIVTLKFELQDWLNGDLINTTFTNQIDWHLKKNLLVKDFSVAGKLVKETILKEYVNKGVHNQKLHDFTANIILERSIGDRWEEFIKSKLGVKVDFDKGKIDWDKLNGEDSDFLATILLQFVLRKNPSPARLRRIWETTQDFFIECSKDMKSLLDISDEDYRYKRLVWYRAVDERGYMEKEYSYKGLDFWIDKKGNAYLISSIAEAIPIIVKKSFKDKAKDTLAIKNTDWLDDILLQDYYTGEYTDINLSGDMATYESYLPYISIINPTPISWQFIISAQSLPCLISNIQNKYYNHFKYVAGKLPLHIGTIFQYYKQPLYIGIKAGRKIRRDITSWNEIQMNGKALDIEEIQKEALKNITIYEKNENPTNYYSFYLTINNKENEYQLYINPEDKKTDICEVDFKNSKPITKIVIYPNTIDFEFLDTNCRRNDICYSKGKRKIEGKSNRPYTWKEWKLFNEFAEYFRNDQNKIAGLHQIINIIYSKLNDWRNDEDSIKKFMLSAFINIFDLKTDNEKDKFAHILIQPTYTDSATTVPKLENILIMPPNEFRRCLLRFLDMYEFWHTALRKI